MRLEVTRKSELALRAIRELAGRDDTTKGAALAASIDTTPAFLAQALAPLVRADHLRSEPGPTGGYRLMATGRRLSVRDVIELIEGPTRIDRCVLRESPCATTGHAAPCALHSAWSAARTSLLRELAAMPVIDVPELSRQTQEV